MKKRIVVLILIGSCLFFSKPVLAKRFTEDIIFPEYSIKTYRANPAISISRTIHYFMDEDEKVFYYLNPKANFFYDMNYLENTSDVDEEILKEISRVIYYGYGYQNQNRLEYYVATQYLLFKAYKEYMITFIDKERNQVFPFQEEIAQIEENMQKNEFQFENRTMNQRTLEIENPYIAKHFEVQGDNIKSEEKNNKIEISLLNDLEEYTLEFIPKMDCSNLEVYGRNGSSQFIHMDLICENTYTRKIYIEHEMEPEPEEKKEEIKLQQDISSEETKEESNTKENIVNVPATGKESFSWILILFLLGDAYYVFKK